MDDSYEPVGWFWQILFLPVRLVWWLFKKLLPLVILAGVAGLVWQWSQRGN
jgi:hypothetical protein